MESQTPPTRSLALKTTITAVTVYTDQALVTRQGQVTLTGSEREITLSNLPLTLKPESVRASGRGTVAVQLAGVRTERVFATEPVADRVAQLTEQIQQVEEQQRSRRDQIEALILQRTFIQGLSEKSVDRFSRSLAQQQVTLAETKNLLNFLGQRYSDLAAAIAQQERELTDLGHQLQALHQQLQQVQTPRPKESYSLAIDITPAGAGEFTLEVSYVCERASWKPLYDCRVDSTTSRLQLTYLAAVKQTTGEDWPHLALTLSTAKPGLGTLPPKLTPWYIDVPSPPMPVAAAPAPAVRMRQAASEPPGMLDQLMAGSATPAEYPQAAPFMEATTVAAQINSEGGVVTFQVDGNNNIPGDGSFHKITIFNDDFPCRLEHVAMPKRVSFAYLQAIVTNPPQGATLLPGQANIFRDRAFVGTATLENVAPGQAFTLNLGIDEGLKLTRDLIERKVDKQLIGGQRRITYGYRLIVTNLRDRQAALRLSEQLPVSRSEQIKVRLTRTSPQIQPGELGLLEWVLQLDANAKQEISYQFVVEHAPSLTVVGLERAEDALSRVYEQLS